MNELKTTPILLDQNSEAYAALIGKVRDYVHRLAKKIGYGYKLDKADIEDVVSSTMEYFHTNYQADVYDRSRDYQAYLYNQVRGRVQQRCRIKRRFGQELPYATADDNHDNESSVIHLQNNHFESANEIFNSDNYNHLLSIINKLSETSRTLINLKAIGYSNQEIACHLGISYNLATVKLFRAKTELEQALKKEGYPIPRRRLSA